MQVNQSSARIGVAMSPVASNALTLWTRSRVQTR
jgi:hypothetical protein